MLELRARASRRGDPGVFNPLTDWGKYLPPVVVDALLVSAPAFMKIVGCIEILAGLAVLIRLTRLGADLVLEGYLDIAVRDFSIAVGAFAQGQAAAFRHDAWLPFGRASRPTEAIAHVH